jgi:hypothetical protein
MKRRLISVFYLESENFSVETGKIISCYETKVMQERPCMYKLNTEARSPNHCCIGKAISITYSKCVSVALVIQHAKRMRHIILSSVACPAVPYFSTLSHKR